MQIAQRIGGLAVDPDLEIQGGDLMRPHTHVRNDLAGRDILPFVHQEFSIVRIGG